jgi:hypothetical protein
MQLTPVKEYRYYIGIPEERDDLKFVLACSHDEEREIMSAIGYPSFEHMEFYIANEELAFVKELEFPGEGIMHLKCYKANHNSWN